MRDTNIVCLYYNVHNKYHKNSAVIYRLFCDGGRHRDVAKISSYFLIKGARGRVVG
jgi:hypothetical protein